MVLCLVAVWSQSAEVAGLPVVAAAVKVLSLADFVVVVVVVAAVVVVVAAAVVVVVTVDNTNTLTYTMHYFKSLCSLHY